MGIWSDVTADHPAPSVSAADQPLPSELPPLREVSPISSESPLLPQLVPGRRTRSEQDWILKINVVKIMWQSYQDDVSGCVWVEVTQSQSCLCIICWTDLQPMCGSLSNTWWSHDIHVVQSYVVHVISPDLPWHPQAVIPVTGLGRRRHPGPLASGGLHPVASPQASGGTSLRGRTGQLRLEDVLIIYNLALLLFLFCHLPLKGSCWGERGREHYDSRAA